MKKLLKLSVFAGLFVFVFMGALQVRAEEGNKGKDRVEAVKALRASDDFPGKNKTTDASGALEIEADIFTDITTVKIEMNNRKSIFTTESKTREEIVQDILAKYPALTLEQVEAALTIETEDRESKPKDTAGEKKSIMSVFSNAKKEENRENKETRFKLPAESVLNRFSGAVKHLEKFIVRIEEAIVRIKADGKDTTVAEGFLTAAKIDLTEAKSHWVEAKTAWDTKADDAREQIKMHLDLMKMEIRSSFENIKASVKALKALREKTQDDSSDDSDDESTDDSGDSSN